MNFTDFTAGLPRLREENPNALALTETRVTKALAGLAGSAFEGLEVQETGYRCHIAQDWHERLCALAPLECFLVSAGVRHSLSVLFREWAKEGRRAALPADVYPVYLQLADAAGLQYGLYTSAADEGFPDLEGFDIVLAANPVKPRGTYLSRRERLQLLGWLAGSAKRRLVLDVVYDLEPGLAQATRYLAQSGQCILLHSLSKAWLAPLRAGAVVVPQQDASFWTPVFRRESVDRGMLAQAHALLTQRPEFPRQVQHAFSSRAAALRGVLQQRNVVESAFPGVASPGYLVCVQGSWPELLAKGLLGLPLEVFGGGNPNVTVLSALGFSASAT